MMQAITDRYAGAQAECASLRKMLAEVPGVRLSDSDSAHWIDYRGLLTVEWQPTQAGKPGIFLTVTGQRTITTQRPDAKAALAYIKGRIAKAEAEAEAHDQRIAQQQAADAQKRMQITAQAHSIGMTYNAGNFESVTGGHDVSIPVVITLKDGEYTAHVDIVIGDAYRFRVTPQRAREIIRTGLNGGQV